MRRLTFLIAATVVAAAAHAELYSWREGGATRYSNAAPPWYSATEPSRIRTRVMVNGILVDDTGLSMEERDRLRAQRAKAEAWNKPGAVVPPPNAASPVAPATSTAKAPAPETGDAAKPPAPPPMGVKPGETPAKPAEPAKGTPSAR